MSLQFRVLSCSDYDNSKNFEELEIWRLAREINIEIHTLLKKCVDDENLSKQINRSAGSIMDNIAEGFERSRSKEFIHFLSIAKALWAELRSQLYRALDRIFINQKILKEVAQRTKIVNQKIGKLMSYLSTSDYSGTKFRRAKPKTRNPKPETQNPKPEIQ